MNVIHYKKCDNCKLVKHILFKCLGNITNRLIQNLANDMVDWSMASQREMMSWLSLDLQCISLLSCAQTVANIEFIRNVCRVVSKPWMHSSSLLLSVVKCVTNQARNQCSGTYTTAHGSLSIQGGLCWLWCVCVFGLKLTLF